MEANLYNQPLKFSLLISNTSRPIPNTKPLTIAVSAPWALIRLKNKPRRKTAAIGGAM